MLHSILYLVSLHHDLQHSAVDSYESLYHGSRAFSMINTHLASGIFADTTIGAVAMLVTKEARPPYP